MDDYLWRFADYLALRDNILYLIDVKAQPYMPLKVAGRWDDFRSSNISFTDREYEAYRHARIPVLILLIHYRDSSAQRSSASVEPVYYGLVPFKDLRFRPEWASGILPKLPEELMQKLEDGEAEKLLRKVRRAELVRLML